MNLIARKITKIFSVLFLSISLLVFFGLLNSCSSKKPVQEEERISEFEEIKKDNLDQDAEDKEKITDVSALEKSKNIVAVIGSGKFFKTSSLEGKKVPGNKADGVILNFIEADIREMSSIILGEILGLNFSLDQDLQGTANFQTVSPITRSDLLPLYQKIMNDHNVAVFDLNGIIHVVGNDKRHSEAAPKLPGTQKIGDAHVTPIALKYVSATQLVEVLGPVLSEMSGVKADPVRNMLLVSGPPQDIISIKELVDLFDVDWLAGGSFALFPLSAADSGTVIYELEKIFETQEGALKGVFTFIPLERLNSILVITKQPEYLARVANWIKRLDQGEKQVGQSLHVFYLTNSEAKNVATVLQQLFGFDNSGSSENIQETKLGKDEESDNYDPASGKNMGSDRDIAPVPTGTVRIIADTENNALVIRASSADYRMIEAAIKRIDLPPIQVMIEATIAEVTLTNDLSFGLSAFFNQGNFSSNLNGGTANVKSNNPAANAAAFVDQGFQFIFKNKNISSTLKLLKTLTDVKVISSPHVFVHNNKKAEIKVGEQIPVKTQSSKSNVTDNSPTVTNIELKDTGTRLEVTARVNADGRITLDLIQSISNREQIVEGQDALEPVISDQSLQTIVTVESGQTVALGGMIKDSESNSNSGIPILMDLPLFGPLFSSNKKVTTRKELLILMTPRVVPTEGEAGAITNELRDRMRNVNKFKFKDHQPVTNIQAQDKLEIERAHKKAQKEAFKQVSESRFTSQNGQVKVKPEVEIAGKAKKFDSLDQAISQLETKEKIQSAQLPASKNTKENVNTSANSAQKPATQKPTKLTDLATIAPQRAASVSQPPLSEEEIVDEIEEFADDEASDSQNADRSSAQYTQTASKEPVAGSKVKPSVLAQPAPSKAIVHVRRFHTREDAQKEWIRLSKKFSKNLDFSKIEIHSDETNPNDPIYNLESSAIDKQSADFFCHSMREKGEECHLAH